MRRVPLSSNQSAKDSGHYHVGHPRAGVPQYGRDVSMETRSMKKFSMLGIVSGAALLAAVPFSLQWSQENVGPAVPLLTLSHANAQYYYGPYRRHVRRVYRRAYRRAYYGYPYSSGGYSPYSYGGYSPYSYGGYSPYSYGGYSPYSYGGYSRPSYFGRWY